MPSILFRLLYFNLLLHVQLVFILHFFLSYCIVEGARDSRISLPATAAVIVVHLTVNHLESNNTHPLAHQHALSLRYSQRPQGSSAVERKNE